MLPKTESFEVGTLDRIFDGGMHGKSLSTIITLPGLSLSPPRILAVARNAESSSQRLCPYYQPTDQESKRGCYVLRGAG